MKNKKNMGREKSNNDREGTQRLMVVYGKMGQLKYKKIAFNWNWTKILRRLL